MSLGVEGPALPWHWREVAGLELDAEEGLERCLAPGAEEGSEIASDGLCRGRNGYPSLHLDSAVLGEPWLLAPGKGTYARTG